MNEHRHRLVLGACGGEGVNGAGGFAGVGREEGRKSEWRGGGSRRHTKHGVERGCGFEVHIGSILSNVTCTVA